MEIFYSMAESLVNMIVGGPGSEITSEQGSAPGRDREKQTVNRGYEIQDEM